MTRQEMADSGREVCAQALLGRDAHADQMGLEDYESGLTDALTNLRHFADRYEVDFFAQLDRSYKHYLHEREFAWGEEPA